MESIHIGGFARSKLAVPQISRRESGDRTKRRKVLLVLQFDLLKILGQHFTARRASPKRLCEGSLNLKSKFRSLLGSLLRRQACDPSRFLWRPGLLTSFTVPAPRGWQGARFGLTGHQPKLVDRATGVGQCRFPDKQLTSSYDLQT